ncbi:MAG TPA: hypothetical protein VI076_05495 [Actinopolymorphaceae bacterium]
MSSTSLSAANAAELLERQDRLQREATRIEAELDLPRLLGRVGRVVRIGSAASGLMVWRDLDVSIYCDGDAPGRNVATALGELMARPGVRELDYRDELGPRSPSGGTHDQRHYATLRYVSAEGETWKVDLSFWTDTGPRGGFSDAAALRRRLTDETRLAILWIKDVLHRLDGYLREFAGIDVYEAVLDEGVRTPAEFEVYLTRRLTEDASRSE